MQASVSVSKCVCIGYFHLNVANAGTCQRYSLQEEACVEAVRSGQAHHAKKNHPYNCIMQARALLQHTSMNATGY